MIYIHDYVLRLSFLIIYDLYPSLLSPITKEATISTSRPVYIHTLVGTFARIHSPLHIPQMVAQTIVNDIKMPHAVNENSPIKLFPMPKKIKLPNQSKPANPL